MGAGVLFTDADGRALLVEPVYKDYWEIVGGCVEENEAPRTAAVREVKEELGKAVSLGRLLVVDWVPPRPDRTEGVMFVYDGGTLDEQGTADIHLPPDELSRWAWCDREQIEQRMSSLLARRVTAALRAKVEGKVFDLENGFQVL
ncbi:ADP-ribose pyrophosphatase YjhB (NUDIX family) [Kribbella steppae]|uniref:ADP-ribose pyrophosphatase YjhB (NUDIX family) n=2 Tax=Kribbella steppae TaxID=2512223 RepID=A0A4R2HB98_9ACTN|nr:ADP-ribose pyrophosphatase YjhB (NUDIX family) [Kribbella steppae]